VNGKTAQRRPTVYVYCLSTSATVCQIALAHWLTWFRYSPATAGPNGGSRQFRISSHTCTHCSVLTGSYYELHTLRPHCQFQPNEMSRSDYDWLMTQYDTLMWPIGPYASCNSKPSGIACMGYRHSASGADCNFAALKSQEMPDAPLSSPFFPVVPSLPDCRPGVRPLRSPPRYATE